MQEERRQCLAAEETSSWLPMFVPILHWQGSASEHWECSPWRVTGVILWLELIPLWGVRKEHTVTSTRHAMMTVLVAESLQPNPSEALCTSFCRQGWRATASSSWKYHRNSLMGKDILDVLGSFVNPKPICCQQKTSLSMLYIPSRPEFPWSSWSRQDRTRCTLWKPRILPRPPTLPHQLYFLSPINQISWMSREPIWMGKYLFFYLTWLLVWSYIFLEQFCSGWSHLCLNELTGIILWTASSTISCALQGRGSLGSILDEFPFLL